MLRPWRTSRLEPPPDPEVVEDFLRQVDETSRWQRLTRKLIVEVGFDLNERPSDVAGLERR